MWNGWPDLGHFGQEETTFRFRSCSWRNHYFKAKIVFSQSVQSLSRVRLFASPWTAACQASLSITNSRSLLKLMSTELVMPSNHLILCCPFSSHLQSLPASGSFQMSQCFSSGGQSIGVFSFNISPSIEYAGLISFRIDWFDLLVVPGTLKSLLQHHSSKVSILRCSAYSFTDLIKEGHYSKLFLLRD